MKRKHKDYQESLLESLKDTKEAIAYLNAALADDDPRVFLLALKDVLTAQDIDISSLQKNPVLLVKISTEYFQQKVIHVGVV